jgi:hypothetical protein
MFGIEVAGRVVEETDERRALSLDDRHREAYPVGRVFSGMVSFTGR